MGRTTGDFFLPQAPIASAIVRMNTAATRVADRVCIDVVL
jgi:hypothetical protein